MSAHKDRLIQAADLLGMDPDDLLSRLDNPLHRDGLPFADGLLRMGRERQAAILDAARVNPEDARTLARIFRELDIHLSAGGNPPEAWHGVVVDADERRVTLPDTPGVGVPESNTVRRFVLSNPEDEPEHIDDVMRQRYNDADVLVLAVGDALAKVESLDGAEFNAWHHELHAGTATPRARFAGYRE